eukprot:gene1254-2718_t
MLLLKALLLAMPLRVLLSGRVLLFSRLASFAGWPPLLLVSLLPLVLTTGLAWVLLLVSRRLVVVMLILRRRVLLSVALTLVRKSQQAQTQQRKAAPPDSPRPRRRAEPNGRPAEVQPTAQQLEERTAAAATKELLQRQQQFDAQAAKLCELSQQLQRSLASNQRQSTALAAGTQENDRIRQGVQGFVDELRSFKPQLFHSSPNLKPQLFLSSSAAAAAQAGRTPAASPPTTAPQVTHPPAQPVAQVASECALHMMRNLLLAWGPAESAEGQRIPSQAQLWAELDSCAHSLESRQRAEGVAPLEHQGTIEGNWTFQCVQEWFHRYLPLIHILHSSTAAPTDHVRLGALLHTTLAPKTKGASGTEHWTTLCPSGSEWVIADSLAYPGQNQGQITPVSVEELLQPGIGKWFVWAPSRAAAQGLPEQAVREMAAGAAGSFGPGSAFSSVEVAHASVD